MSSQQVQKVNEEFRNKLLKHKAIIEKYLNKKTQPQNTPTSDLSLSNPSLNNITPQTITHKQTEIQKQKQNTQPQYKPNTHSPQVSTTHQAQIIDHIDQILNKVKKATPIIPSYDYKNKVTPTPPYLTNTYHSQTIADSNYHHFNYNLHPIRDSDNFSKTSYQNHKEEELPKSLIMDYSSNNQLNETEHYSDPQVQQEDEQQMYEIDYSNHDQSQISRFSDDNLDRSKKIDKKCNIPLPPPNPRDNQKQIMKQALLKFREAASEINHHDHDEDESLNFDLSRSMTMDQLEQSSKNNTFDKQTDSRLVELYQQRSAIMKELEALDQELRELN